MSDPDDAPPSYFCPISMELMRYPVITTDGLCYDRANIEQWFAGGNSTSPLSGASLDSTTLIPNISLRQAIQDWEEKHSKVLQRGSLNPVLSSPPHSASDTFSRATQIGVGSCAWMVRLLSFGLKMLLLLLLLTVPVALLQPTLAYSTAATQALVHVLDGGGLIVASVSGTIAALDAGTLLATIAFFAWVLYSTFGWWMYGGTSRINGPGDIADSQYYESEEIKEALIVGGGVAFTINDRDAIPYRKYAESAEVPETLVIPGRIASIGGEAFMSCKQLKSVVLEDGVTTIGRYAFYKCRALASVSIPDSVTKIGGDAFWDTALTAVSIPAAATYSTDYYDNGSYNFPSFPPGCVVTRRA